MPLKDDPECYHAEYGIEEWNCEGEAEAVYDRDGEVIGYKSLCPTCWQMREVILEFPCQDQYCLGDQTIRLKGSQVAGHYRNMAEDPKWTFPPLRCEACREWLRNVSQGEKSCDACGRIFVVVAGHFKYVKKHLGDPAIHSQRFCLRCDRLTEEERQTLVRKRFTVKGRYKDRSKRFQEAMLLVESGISQEILKDEKLRAKDVVKMLQPTSLPPKGTKEDIARYAVRLSGDRSKPNETRLEHIEAHKGEFIPPFGTVEEQLANADRVLANSNQDQVLNLVDKVSKYSIKLELTTGTLVVFNSQGHITNYPICRSHYGDKSAYIRYVHMKVKKGQWAAPD